MIDDICAYTLEIRGRVHADDLNAASPLHVTVERSDDACSLLSARTDQSGLIGLIRHLHNLGFVLLSMQAQYSASNKTNHSDPRQG